MRNYQNSRPNRMERDLRNEPDTDHYIPNYDRDGYVPGPRYGNKPEVLSNPSFGPNNPGGFPIMGKYICILYLKTLLTFFFFFR